MSSGPSICFIHYQTTCMRQMFKHFRAPSHADTASGHYSKLFTCMQGVLGYQKAKQSKRTTHKMWPRRLRTCDKLYCVAFLNIIPKHTIEWVSRQWIRPPTNKDAQAHIHLPNLSVRISVRIGTEPAQCVTRQTKSPDRLDSKSIICKY